MKPFLKIMSCICMCVSNVFYWSPGSFFWKNTQLLSISTNFRVQRCSSSFPTRVARQSSTCVHNLFNEKAIHPFLHRPYCPSPNCLGIPRANHFVVLLESRRWIPRACTRARLCAATCWSPPSMHPLLWLEVSPIVPAKWKKKEKNNH